MNEKTVEVQEDVVETEETVVETDETVVEEEGVEIDVAAIKEENKSEFDESDESDDAPAWADEDLAWDHVPDNVAELMKKQKWITDEGDPDYSKLADAHASLRKKFSEKHELPENADGYQMDFGEDVDIDVERNKAFREAALEQGISTKQMSWLMKEFQTEISSAIEKNLPTATADIAKTMKGEWGEEYEDNMKVVSTVWKELTDGADPNEHAMLTNNPVFLKLAYAHGAEKVSDRASRKDLGDGGRRVYTRQDIDKLMFSTDPEDQAIVDAYYEKITATQ